MNLDTVKAKAKQAYTKAEDKYYNLIEKTGLYKLVDPLEAKGIKSFPIALGLVVVVLALIAWGITSLAVPGTVNITFLVTDIGEQPLEGALILFEEKELSTNQDGLAEAKIGKDERLEISVHKEGFQSEERTIIGLEDITEAITLNRTIVEEDVDVVLYLMDSSTKKFLTGKQVSLKFECSGKKELAPEQITTTQSSIEVTRKSGCGTLMVFADAEGYNPLSVSVKEARATLSFSPLQLAKGKVKALVLYKNQRIASIRVKLLTEDGIEADEGLTGSTGEYVFEDVLEGRYAVRAYDSAGEYVSTRSDYTQIKANKVNDITINIQKEAIGRFKVTVKDVNGLVDGAMVRLFDSFNEELYSEETEQGQVMFGVTENITYYITVYEEKHKSKIVQDLKIDTAKEFTEVNVVLEPCTAESCLQLTAKVEDEKGNLLENAKVVLFNAYTQQNIGLGEQVSDMFGLARFENLPEGRYYAKAYLGTSSGESSPVDVAPGIVALAVVTVQVGYGGVKMLVTDNEGNAIDFAEVLAFDQVTGEAMWTGPEKTTVEGELPITEFLATRKVFFKISKEGFLDYYTAPVAMQAGKIKSLKIVLEKGIERLDVKLVGLYYWDGTDTLDEEENTRVMSIGESLYDKVITAKFKMLLPKDYTTGEFFLRAGPSPNRPYTEEEPIVLSSAYGHNAVIAKGTKYNPPDNEDSDLVSLTEGDSKWAKISFDNIGKGVHEVKVNFKIRGELIDLYKDDAKLFYRASMDGEERAPAVEILSTDPLYAKAKEYILPLGATTMCGELFCYSFTMEDLVREQLFEILSRSTFTGRVNNPYKLHASILNISAQTFLDSELIIEEPSPSQEVKRILSFGDYTINTAEGISITGTSELKNNLIQEPIGSVLKNTPVNYELGFEIDGNAAGSNTSPKIRTAIVSEKETFFDEEINVKVVETAKMFLEVRTSVQAAEAKTPIVLAGAETGLKMHVTEEIGKGDELIINDVYEAKVMVKSGGQTLDTGYTDQDGIYEWTLPAQDAGTEIEITSEYPGYATEIVKIKVNDNLFEVIPPVLEPVFVIGKGTKKAIEELTLVNNTLLDLTILHASIKPLNDSFKYYLVLDDDEVRSSLEAYAGKKILKNTSQFMPELLLKMNFEVGIPTVQPLGTLELEVLGEVQGAQKTWFTYIDITPLVIRPGELDASDCLRAELIEDDERAEWGFTSFGYPDSFNFNIINDCEYTPEKGEKTKVGLEDITATIEWTGIANGKIYLETGRYSPELAGTPAKILDQIAEGGTVTARLIFKPLGRRGETGDFTIKLKGKYLSEDGEKKITSDSAIPSGRTIKTYVNDIEKCIALSGPGIGDEEPQMVGGISDVRVGTTGDCVLYGDQIEVHLSNNSKLRIDGTRNTTITLDYYTPEEYIEVEAADNTAGIQPILYKMWPKGEPEHASRTRIEDIVFAVDPSYYTVDLERYSFLLEPPAVSPRDQLPSTMIIKTLPDKQKVIPGSDFLIDMPETNLDIFFEYLRPPDLTNVRKQDDYVNLSRRYGVLNHGVDGLTYGKIRVKWDLLSFKTKANWDADIRLTDNTHTDTFWVKINGTGQQTIDLPSQSTGAVYRCAGEQGKVGITGPDATPKVKYDWDFYKIGHDMCDVTNEDGVYCDMTQFSATLSKKLYILEKFLEQNDLVCPYTVDDRDGTIDNVFDLPPLEQSDVRIAALPQVEIDPDKVIINVPIKNSYNGQLNADVMVFLLDDGRDTGNLTGDEVQAIGDCMAGANIDTIEARLVCRQKNFTLSAGNFQNPSESTYSCTINDLPLMDPIGGTIPAYRALALVRIPDSRNPTECTDHEDDEYACCADNQGNPRQCNAGEEKDDTCIDPAKDTVKENNYAQVYFYYDPESLDPDGCIREKNALNLREYLEATDMTGGTNYYLSQALGTGFDVDISSIDDIIDLEEGADSILHYSAYLMDDDMSSDFRQDFTDYYVSGGTIRAPDFFIEEMHKYFTRPGRLELERANLSDMSVSTDPIPRPGIYDVFINIDFTERGEWRLFESKEPIAKVKVELQFKGNPPIYSKLYEYPLDGKIGVNSQNKIDRQDYGVDFEGSAIPLSAELVETIIVESASTSNALKTLNSSIISDFTQLNTPNNRKGDVLWFQNNDLYYAPTVAAPITFKSGQNNIAYQITDATSQNITPTIDNLASWLPFAAENNNACGQMGTQRDEYNASQQAMTLNNVRGYYKTTFYKPLAATYKIVKTDEEANFGFYRQGTANHVSLPLVSYDQQSIIESLEEVLDLVDAGEVCVVPSGDEYFWNLNKVYAKDPGVASPEPGQTRCQYSGDYVCDPAEGGIDCEISLEDLLGDIPEYRTPNPFMGDSDIVFGPRNPETRALIYNASNRAFLGNRGKWNIYNRAQDVLNKPAPYYGFNEPSHKGQKRNCDEEYGCCGSNWGCDKGPTNSAYTEGFCYKKNGDCPSFPSWGSITCGWWGWNRRCTDYDCYVGWMAESPGFCWANISLGWLSNSLMGMEENKVNRVQHYNDSVRAVMRKTLCVPVFQVHYPDYPCPT